MVGFAKVRMSLFIKGSELNPYKIQENNIKKLLEENWKKTNIFKGYF